MILDDFGISKYWIVFDFQVIDRATMVKTKGWGLTKVPTSLQVTLVFIFSYVLTLSGHFWRVKWFMLRPKSSFSYNWTTMWTDWLLMLLTCSCSIHSTVAKRPINVEESIGISCWFFWLVEIRHNWMLAEMAIWSYTSHGGHSKKLKASRAPVIDMPGSPARLVDQSTNRDHQNI